ncbi:G-protein coupled receptor 183-like [Littorina saxatilis]|uniref:G-protein coupled receptors family 1 profile domain-containing protein n=1 Tax=Littorina saxatilis TaxID=31220 RepID=A0AAN9BSM4_9CAEN
MASATTDSGVKVTSLLGLANMTLTHSLLNASDTTSGTPTLTPEERAQVEQYMATIDAIKQTYMWIIFAFGFPGNLISLVIILRLRCFGSPALYVATLAVVDNAAIMVKLLLVLFGEYKVSIGLMGCKAMFFLGNHLVVYANWVLVTMALERFVAVWQPLRVNRMWSTRKAAISLTVVLLVTVALTSPLFVTVTVTDKGGKQTCAVDPQYRLFMSIWQWCQVAAYGFLPCVMLLTLNVFIIVIISRARRFHRSMNPSFKSNGSATNNNSNNASTSSSCSMPGGGVQRQATILLLVTSAVLVITTTPVCVYILLQQWWQPRPGTVDFARKQLVGFVLRAVCDANHSVNFYLYFVSARKFRAYFCKAVCWLCHRHGSGRGFDTATRHFSNTRSTLRLKDKSQGHMLLYQRKKTEKDDDDDGENSESIKLAQHNGCLATTCSSPL